MKKNPISAARRAYDSVDGRYEPIMSYISKIERKQNLFL